MSYKYKINNSPDYNLNKSAQIFSYNYYFINHFINFIINTFVKSTNLPFISIGLYIIVIVLNSIQYSNHKTYLQDKIKNSVSTAPDSTSPQNVMLYIYDIIGINAFTRNGLAHILFFLVTYICLGLVEMNIGYINTIFFLIIILMFSYFIGGFDLAFCENDLSYGDTIGNSSYCCGSMILWSALGFTLFIIQKNVNNLYKKMYVWFIIACVWGGCILYENYSTYDNLKTSNQKNCKLFLRHAAVYVFGIFCGLVLAK